MPPAHYSLRDFVRERVATTEDWAEWNRVASSKPPGTRPVLPNGPYEDFYHEPLPPSEEFLIKSQLEPRLVEAVRQVLLSGEWEVSGRNGGPATRQVLEPTDIAHSVIDLKTFAIGPWALVRVSQARATSNREVLERFIETVCRVVGQPGKRLSKPVIDDLAQALCSDSYSSAAFLAAWEDAKIEEGWRKAGRR